MKRPDVRIVGKHAKDCYAIKNANAGIWESPWCEYPDGSESRDKRGSSRRGHTVWIRFLCNCTQCPAVAWIKAKDITMMMPKGEVKQR